MLLRRLETLQNTLEPAEEQLAGQSVSTASRSLAVPTLLALKRNKVRLQSLLSAILLLIVLSLQEESCILDGFSEE